MRFSERQGLVSVRSVLQKEGMETALRSGLWDGIHMLLVEREAESWREIGDSQFQRIFLRLWHIFFKKPVDSMPRSLRHVWVEVRTFFFACEWYEVYDLIEFLTEDLLEEDQSLAESLTKFVNNVLERELSAFRLIDGQVTPVTSEEEIASIESALDNTSTLSGAHSHLKAALTLLANRTNPDFRNSVKESISAVESLAKSLTGQPKATLGEALQKLETEGMIHPALKRSLTALYGYTSDADGIRHAMLDEPNLNLTDAKFMLVSCTGFINYLVAKAAEGGIPLRS